MTFLYFVRNLLLSKINPEFIDDGAMLPLSYNWTKDASLRESIKRIHFESRPQDANGRDILIDVNEKVRVDALFKNLPIPK